MELLDLPPEIFQKVIESYVHTVGVCKAWKRRKVCKTFAAFISEECLGRQSMTAYSDPRAKKLVAQNLGLFLQYRFKVSHGAPALLTTLIRNVVYQFMTATSQSTQTVRAAYTEKACNAIKGCCSIWSAVHLATSPYSLACTMVSNERVEAHCLVIAVWMKDLELVTHYLSHGVSIWDKPGVFLSPIAVAAQIRANDVVSQLLEHARSLLTNTAKAKLNRALDDATWAAVASRHWDTATVLIDWWFQHCRKPQPPTIVAWVSKAISAHATDFLHELLEQNLSLATKSLLIKRLYGPEVESWGDGAQELLIEASIGRNLMDLRGGYHRKRPRSFSGSLLALAARKCDIKIAKKCLEWGMSSNGLRSVSDRFEHPLVGAVARSDKAMVKLLLAHDADPEPAHNHIVRFGLRRKSRGKISKKIAKLIQKAVDRKKANAITDA
ncbi:hypothetical protein J4E91_004388 [Alternaria rosae]|nr:hypothetical protein J4E91_004388 [Alternaria rosae]